MINQKIAVTQFLCLLSVLTGFAALAADPSLPDLPTFNWDPSSDPNVIGYRLYQGTTSQVYSTVLDLGNQTTFTLSSATAGQTYYFAVTAYDNSGQESPFSDEIVYAVPAVAVEPLNLQIQPGVPNQITLIGTGPTGATLLIEAAQDLSSWAQIGTVTPDSNGSFQFIDASSALFSWRYYRLRQTQ